MAISYVTPHYGMLDIWRSRSFESIWHFNQAAGEGAPLNEPCTVYIQQQREILADALYRALKMVEPYLHFSPVQYWTSEDVELRWGYPYQLQNLKTSLGYVQAFGQRATSLIDDAVTVTYDDTDGDGVNDRATMTVTTDVAADEIQAFFRTDDGAPSAGHELWQIEPLTVTKSGSTATIRGHRALFVDPADIWNKPYDDVNFIDKREADPTNAAHFVESVDVYRVYNDTSVPAQLLHDPIYTQTSSLGTVLTTTAVPLLWSSPVGDFRIRLDGTACASGYSEKVRVYYKHGLPLVQGTLRADYAQMLVRLANTLVSPQWVEGQCDRSRNFFENDQLYVPPELRQQYANPFGLQQGAVAAWQFVNTHALGVGSKV